LWAGILGGHCGRRVHTLRDSACGGRLCPRSFPNRDHPRWDEARIFDTCWAWLAVERDPSSSIKLGVAFGGE